MKNLSVSKQFGLAEKIRSPQKVVSALPLLKTKVNHKLSPSLQVHNLELQLTGSENCNLHCWYCSTRRWGAGKDKTAPFLDKILLEKLAIFTPKSIILSGGEPTLYQPAPDFGFNEALCLLREKIPGVKFGLITNGTLIPHGNWPNFCEWVRISLDAGIRETYLKLKKADLFNTVISNLRQYLQTKIPYIGIGYVYQKENFGEIPDLLKLVFKKFYQGNEKRINVQFRPIVYYPNHLPSNKEKKELQKFLKSATQEFKKFLSFNTNLKIVFAPLKTKTESSSSFSNCYLSLIHKGITSSGEIFPCCLMFKNKNSSLGNLARDSEAEILKKEKNFFIASSCKNNCRFAVKNTILQKALKGEGEIGSKDFMTRHQASFICPDFF